MGQQDDWIKRVIEDQGAECGNCRQWRILKDGYYIEQCPECGDEAFDLYEMAEAEIAVSGCLCHKYPHDINCPESGANLFLRAGGV